MKKNRYKPYGLNMDYEFKTYMKIGKDYGNRKTRNLGVLLNFRRWCRKKINKNEKRYKFCDTYPEWEQHVKNIIPNMIMNYNDMIHWLNREKEDETIFLNCIKIILIPIYLALFTFFLNGENELTIIMLSVIILVFSVSALFKYSKKVYFYDDFIKVVKKIQESSYNKRGKIVKEDNIVYYYSDVATVLSVLKNNELWLTNSRNLNDSNEEISVHKIFCEQLEAYDDLNERKLNNFFKVVSVDGIFQTYTHCLGTEAYYIACFSRDMDSVSQWMSYGDGGNGIAIGFDGDEFEKISGEGMIDYFQVEYIDYEHIQTEVKDIYEKMIMCDENNGAEMLDVFMKYMMNKYEHPEKYKSYHYANEKEVRLVLDRTADRKTELDEWKIGGVETYAKRNCINTYVTLSFPKTAVKKIVLGPMYQRNYFEAEFTIMDVLGYGDVEIVNSTSGFRGIGKK